MTVLRPCLDCGTPTDGAIRCPDCRAERNARTDRSRGNFRQRGYGNGWDALSRRARRAQPFCTDCGTSDDLSVDHLPGAWEKVQAGQRLTLADVEVVCGPCNNRRGARRAGTTRGVTPPTRRSVPAAQPGIRLHTGGAA